jgi:hypothetical protein
MHLNQILFPAIEILLQAPKFRKILIQIQLIRNLKKEVIFWAHAIT